MSPVMRLFTIWRTLRRHHLADVIHQLPLTKKSRMLTTCLLGKTPSQTASQAVRIRSALQELGPIFIKFGQMLSTRADLIPSDIAHELGKLQDQVPSFDSNHALSIIRQTFNDYDDIFESIDPVPLAAASVAQVHSARLHKDKALIGKNGKLCPDVVIKLIRPEIEILINKDLIILKWLAKLLQRLLKDSDLYQPTSIVDEYKTTIIDELDLRREAAHCAHMRENFEGSDLIYVPTVYWDYTFRHLMVMERIYGTSVREIDQLVSQGVDLARLAADGVEIFFKQAFEDNFFHADMHPGNVFICDQGHWLAIDFGIMGSLTDDDKYFLAENFLGFFRRDYRLIAKNYLRAGWIPADTRLHDFETAIRMACEPSFAKPIAEISFSKVLLQLLEIARRFRMPLQPQLLLLYKTLLNIEGLGRTLHPQLNLWETAMPFLEKWMKQQLSPCHMMQDFVADFPRWKSLLEKLPNTLEMCIENMKRES